MNPVFLIIVVVVVIAIAIIVAIALKKKPESFSMSMASCKRDQDPQTIAYLRRVYPNSSLCKTPEVHFLYSCAPESFKDRYRPLYDAENSKDYAPVPLYATWRPIWYTTDTFSVNLYPPKRWWEYEFLNTYPSFSVVEGHHIKDDNPLYTVYGFWIYLTKGTGVFYNLGRTLQTQNKIHALRVLGYSLEQIAYIIKDKRYYYNPDKPNLLISDEAKRFRGNNVIEKVVGLIEAILGNVGDYDADRINNTADFDDIITKDARAQGYDSIQFQVQANCFGGWAHEIVVVSPSPLEKAREADWQGWGDMKNMMTMNDPDGVRYPIACEPSIGSAIITCTAQGLQNCVAEEPTVPSTY